MSRSPEQASSPESIVRRWIAAFNAHDAEALVALYREEAELFDSGMKRPRRGRSEIAGWFAWRFASTPTIRYTPGPIESSGEGRVVVRWMASGQGPRLLGLGWLARPFRVEGQSEFTLADGLIARQRGSYDHLLVLRQLVPPLRWLPGVCATLVYTVYMWRKGPRE